MRNLIWAALAGAFLLAGFGVASADDTVRLGGPSAESVIRGGTDAQLVHLRYGYYRGYGYARSYYRGYYPYYNYYARSYYAPRYYASAYYAPAYYAPSYYAPSYYAPAYYAPTYYAPNYSAYYYYPVAGESLPPPATTMQGTFYQTPTQEPMGNGTFQYNGGPRSPIPMPNPSTPPSGIVPIDGRLVSLPTKTTGGSSQHGTTTQRAATTPSVNYPAYGEEPITPAPRKTK